MEELAAILQQNGIYTKSLSLYLDTGQEIIYELITTGQDSITLWQKLRNLTEQTGFYPVVIGDGKEIILADFEYKRNNTNTQHILDESLQIDAVEWLQYEFDGMFDNEEDYTSLHEEWSSEFQPGNGFTINTNISTEKILDHLSMILVPTKNSWEVPAILRFGDWNACPKPAVHVSILKYWHEVYEAEIVGLKHDTLELSVSKPPHNQVEALKLAELQWAYCCDIVEQGAGSFEALAAMLLDGTVWHFWWD